MAIFYPWGQRYFDALTRTSGEAQLKEILTWGMELTFSPGLRNEGDRTPALDVSALRRAINATNDPARVRRELQLIGLLLAAGADPNLPNLYGYTPLH
jgi:hypothetical protein